jgi:hypothetical protein
VVCSSRDIEPPDPTRPQAREAGVVRGLVRSPLSGLWASSYYPALSKDLSGSAGDHFVRYETAQSIQAKGDYLKAQGLGGAIVFEVTQDYLSEQPPGDAQHPLMTAVRQYILH